ncbi:DUF2339 domain-containing protein [Rubrivirga sp.]|uniref:DUF2339 domain-containing protein n=1 Tax=Rubrivirga sp. TaxID=1885344 RepID=UPI003B52278C
MLRTLSIVLGIGVVAWAALTTTDDAVAVLAVAVGVLTALHLRAHDRIAALEARLDALLRSRAARAAEAEPAGPSEVPILVPPDTEEPERDAPTEGAVPVEGPEPRPARVPAMGRPTRPPLPSLPSLDGLPPPLRRAWDFATGGNLVARLSLLVLFVGLGLLIRYAVAEGFLSVEIRLALAAAAGLALVGLGWRLREGTPGFGLTLQGGGVAVLYLTIYGAYALYGLIPSLPAILLMGVVSVACGGLAVVQDAPGLAVLGVAGGFAAPVLAGTAEGNHVLLLSYYALLNVGVLGASWARGWRSVAVVGFLATFVTGGLWGGLQYEPRLYASVQPFVVVSFAIYLALAVRFALRSARVEATPERALAVDGALVFGLPAATFVLQAGIVEGVVPFGRAWSAAALAAVYLVGAGALRQRAGVRLLADAFLAVGLAFATLALPLAFERVVFGALWVLEGAGLVWVGARQRKAWMRAGGLALQGVAAAVLFAEGVLAPSSTFTAASLTGWIVAVGLGLSAYVLREMRRGGAVATDDDAVRGNTMPGRDTMRGVPTADEEKGSRSSPVGWAAAERLAGRVFLAFALFWWTTTAAVHVLDLAPGRFVLAGLLGAAAASAALFLGMGRALGWPGLAAASFGVVPVGWLLWAFAVVDGGDPAVSWRGVAWLALFAVAALALRSERAHRWRAPASVGAVWLATAVLAWALSDAVATATVGDWPLGASGAVLAAALALAVGMPPSWASARERAQSVGGLAVAAGLWVVASWGLPGEATPLPTLPVLNPLGVPAVAVLLGLVAARRRSAGRRDVWTVAVAALGVGALTVAVLRAVHAAGAAPWTAEGLFDSSTAQAALAVTWTLLALVLTVWAVRVESRGLWFFGVGVLAVVGVKLFLVDLSQAEALVRIAAFITVGTIGLLIGYRAPLPPRRGEEGGE